MVLGKEGKRASFLSIFCIPFFATTISSRKLSLIQLFTFRLFLRSESIANRGSNTNNNNKRRQRKTETLLSCPGTLQEARRQNPKEGVEGLTAGSRRSVHDPGPRARHY